MIFSLFINNPFVKSWVDKEGYKSVLIKILRGIFVFVFSIFGLFVIIYSFYRLFYFLKAPMTPITFLDYVCFSWFILMIKLYMKK